MRNIIAIILGGYGLYKLAYTRGEYNGVSRGYREGMLAANQIESKIRTEYLKEKLS